MAQKTFDEAEIASAVLAVLNSRDRRSLEASSVRGSASSPSVLPTSPPLESSSSSRYAHVADRISVQPSMPCRYRRPTVYDGQMQTWRKRRSKGEPKRAAKRRQGHMYNRNVFLLPAKDEPLLSRHSDRFSIPRGEFRAHLIDQGLLARVQFCGDASADKMRETLLEPLNVSKQLKFSFLTSAGFGAKMLATDIKLLCNISPSERQRSKKQDVF